MKTKRIVVNIETSTPPAADKFYRDLFGLDLLMDLDWIRTYGSTAQMSVQISFATEGGSGAPVPDISIEVDDIDAALKRVEQTNLPIEYGPVSEPWGVTRFFIRDPFGKLVNVLQHD